MSATGEPGANPSEEELRAAYEAQLKQVRVEHILLDNVVALINLGMRRTGLVPGTEDERDSAQVRLAIESVRALLPQLEATAPEELDQIRSAVSQLQMAYVQITGAGPEAPGAGAAGSGVGPEAARPGVPGPGRGGAGAGAPPPPSPPPGSAPEPPPGSGEPGPAQRSGRLWIPGQ